MSPPDAEGRHATTFYRRYGKRAFDLALVVPGLLICMPLLLILAVATRLSLGPPILFRQQRPGLGGAPFTIYKFRTMRDLRDERGSLASDEQRITRFGRLLRATSFDELPELINVVKGEMSLVGPRPLLMQYLDRYSAEQFRRHEARPGITGLAQIRGRNLVSWPERFAHDVWYVDHCGLGLDLKILASTVWTVIKREGISSEGHVTMPEFKGSENREEPG